MAINSRRKGGNGEREFAEWVHNLLGLINKPKRNLEQVRSGGTDLIVPPFAFEVKRCEKLQLRKWWVQVVKAVKDKDGLAHNLIPVVAYRQNKQGWRILISAQYIGLDHGYLALGLNESREWLRICYERMRLAKPRKDDNDLYIDTYRNMHF